MLDPTVVAVVLLAPPALYGIARVIEDYRERRRTRAYWRQERARAAAYRANHPTQWTRP